MTKESWAFSGMPVGKRSRSRLKQTKGKCYVCDHVISVVCANCGGELVVVDVRGETVRGSEATEMRVRSCGCKGGEAGGAVR